MKVTAVCVAGYLIWVVSICAPHIHHPQFLERAGAIGVVIFLVVVLMIVVHNRHKRRLGL